ncbi:MAG: cation diffusion facilitator family transporter [Desulfobacterales bacterium]|nr:cation diffusion facilitator family transporter [Desulfobacterales bacterium]
MKNKIENLKRGRRIAFISSFVTFLSALVKGIVGYLFNSPVLIADAFHSGSDLLTHFASAMGLWIATRAKTTKFPYGLYRAETIACLVIGGLIIMVGIGLFWDGFQKLLTLDAVTTFPAIPIAASLFSTTAAIIVAKMESKVGKSIGSQSLIANSREQFLDIFTSMVVLTGILLAYFKIPYAEGSIIILISILLIKLGVENIWTSLLILMDANLDPELQVEIEKKVNEIYGVKGVSSIKIRQSGPFKMVECVIATKPSLSLYQAHELANKIEDLIEKNHKHIESVFIHVEPMKDKTLLAMIPVKNIEGLDSEIHGHCARAPYFIIVKLRDKQIEIEDFFVNEFFKEKKHIGVKIARIAVKYKLDLLFTASIGEISFHMLKDNLIDIYKADEGLKVKEIINSYHLNQLQILTDPTHSIEESLVSR